MDRLPKLVLKLSAPGKTLSEVEQWAIDSLLPRIALFVTNGFRVQLQVLQVPDGTFEIYPKIAGEFRSDLDWAVLREKLENDWSARAQLATMTVIGFHP